MESSIKPMWRDNLRKRNNNENCGKINTSEKADTTAQIMMTKWPIVPTWISKLLKNKEAKGLKNNILKTSSSLSTNT